MFYDVTQIKRLSTKSGTTESVDTDAAIDNLSNTKIAQNAPGVNSEDMQKSGNNAQENENQM